jgi:hypothetical protein
MPLNFEEVSLYPRCHDEFANSIPFAPKFFNVWVRDSACPGIAAAGLSRWDFKPDMESHANDW